MKHRMSCMTELGRKANSVLTFGITVKYAERPLPDGRGSE